MASNLGYPVVNQVGQVIDPTGLNTPQGTQNPINLGNQGEQLAAELHGKYYTAAIRGAVYSFRTAEAGVTVPISSATAGVYMIRNPAGSGKVLELIRCVVGPLTATFVVGVMGFGWQADTAATTYTTAGVLVGALQNGPIRPSVATVWTGVTQTAIVATGGNFKPLFTFPATANTNAGNFEYDFDGTYLLPPGNQISMIMAGAAQTGAMLIDTVWAEWPYPPN